MQRIKADPAVLVLADGSRYPGAALGATGQTLGELVFATGMTGYQETLSDPSYAGQIVLMTAPHIGNTGMNDEDLESTKLWVEGLVVRDAARRHSNFRAQRSLQEDLEAQGIVSIEGVDTRQITRHVRTAGASPAGIFSGAAYQLSETEQLQLVQNHGGMSGRNLAERVTSAKPYTMAPTASRIGAIAVVDLGVKLSTLRFLAAQGFEVQVYGATVTANEIIGGGADAFFFSNGPGDPAASTAQVELLRELLKAGLPYFGICFGNQLLGRAMGLETYKLPFGHRGINQPVVELETGRVEITSQNHGFAVKAQSDTVYSSPHGLGRVKVSHLSLNDSVVEGLECLDVPAFSVQYHPEAAAGPHDALHLFARFSEIVRARARMEDEA